jgi:hypothetical protein
MHQKPLLVRVAITLLVCGLLASLILVPSAAAAQTTTLTPVVDAYVKADSPSTNYGTGTTLRADASPVVNTYLRFDVASLTGITNAKLRIYANSASTQGLVVYAVPDDNWGEMALNYTNAPALAGKLGESLAAITASSWVTVDVSSYITGNGMYSFWVATPGTTAISLASRESGANAPQLVVTYGGISATATPGQATVTKPAPTATKGTVNTPAPTATSGGGTTTCSPVVLKKGPTLIYTGNNTQMRVTWQWSSNASFKVEWGTSTAYSSGSASLSATDTGNSIYRYDIGGLTPGTKYYYRVVVGTQCASGTFYAGPAAGTSSIKFFSYGDTRTNGSAHNNIAGQVVAAYNADPAFQTINLNVGDWVSGDSESAWAGEWFGSSFTNIRAQDGNISDIGVRGNHEGGATYWKRYWPEPFQSGGLYWSFDYGPMHVVMLDQYTSYSAGSTQYSWLKNDLASSSKTWKIVVLHEPGWSAGGGHSNNTTVQNDLQPLFVQYGVAIVFGGHNHYYARASVGGVTHLTMGGGGAPSYSPASGQSNIVKTFKGYSFGEFTISGKTLTAKILSNSGATVDTFTITK